MGRSRRLFDHRIALLLFSGPLEATAMKLDQSRIVLRPRTGAEVLDLACRLSCSLGLGVYLRLAIPVLLPGFVGCLLLRYLWDCSWFWVWVAAAGWGSLVQGVFTQAVGKLLFAESLTAREVLASFFGRTIAYFGAWLMSRVLMAFGAALLILFPVFWVRTIYIYEAALLEGAGPYDAVRRAGQFVAGRGLDTFLVLLALLGAQGGFIIVAELIGDGVLDSVLQLGRPFGTLLDDGGSPAALLGFLLSVPFVATARFLQYIDIRTRSDGWDIQVRFMAIATRASGHMPTATRGGGGPRTTTRASGPSPAILASGGHS